ncbi:hypothetical protein MA16_Dca016030 [Dendrobium catenatum]|uniref:Uncharacterized protein n=1 Tax=Dendrobium catenatum TaxID=906689 RepID=A0A2I0VJS6_9ASPA|nr:hypothetical protein MA16_Dca016030 [Dendrobium catenatum]
MKETNPTGNLIPSDLYRIKKLVSKLGITATKINCCINGCMLYYKDDAAENPKAKIDVFFQPLIDDLKLLWEEGVLTYDISTK